jgi:hypothetical protein
LFSSSAFGALTVEGQRRAPYSLFPEKNLKVARFFSATKKNPLKSEE